MNLPPKTIHLSPPFSRALRRCSRGFTLIEVAMALGIFSFAIIPVIGMMGTAQNVSQESIRASTRARMFEQITPLIANSSPLPSSGLTFVFTGNGQLTTGGSGTWVQTNSSGTGQMSPYVLTTSTSGTGTLTPIYAATCTDVSSSLSGTNSPNNAAGGLTSTKVIKVSIQHYMSGATNTTGTLGTTFVMFSKDPKDLP